jgi:hypothetical protein
MSKPIILNYYEFDHNKHEKYLISRRETFKLKCNYCAKEISASVEVTSNWVTHLKTKHIENYQKYEKEKKSYHIETVKFCFSFYKTFLLLLYI